MPSSHYRVLKLRDKSMCLSLRKGMSTRPTSAQSGSWIHILDHRPWVHCWKLWISPSLFKIPGDLIRMRDILVGKDLGKDYFLSWLLFWNWIISYSATGLCFLILFLHLLLTPSPFSFSPCFPNMISLIWLLFAFIFGFLCSHFFPLSLFLAIYPYPRVRGKRYKFYEKSLSYLAHSRFSHVQLCVTLWTVACQAPLSIGFSKARILEWIALSSKGSSWCRDRKNLWCLLHCRQILYPLSSLRRPMIWPSTFKSSIRIWYLVSDHFKWSCQLSEKEKVKGGEWIWKVLKRRGWSL